MNSQKKLSQTLLSHQEGLPGIEEQDLEGVTGGGLADLLKPLLSKGPRTPESAGAPRNGSYLPPQSDNERRMMLEYVNSAYPGVNGLLQRVALKREIEKAYHPQGQN